MNSEEFILWLSESYYVHNGNSVSVANRLFNIVQELNDFAGLKEFIARNHTYRTMPPEKLFYQYMDLHKPDNSLHEFIYCTKCDVYFYGCYAGKKTKSKWNDYVKRCPVCHTSNYFKIVKSNEWKAAIPVKDHCYGSSSMGCLDKKDLPGAKCSDWGRGEYQEYCKSCQCQKCCADEYRMRQEERERNDKRVS